MRKLSVAIAVVLAVMLVPAASWAIGLEAAVGMWQQDPSGTLEYNDGPLDLVDTLGFDKESRFMVRVKLDMPLIIPNVYFMATPMSFEGKGQVGFKYGGGDFGVDTSTEMVLDQYDVALYYSVPFLSTLSDNMLNVEFGINARVIQIEGTMTNAAITRTKSVDAVVPMLYLGAQVRPIDSLALEAELRMLSIGGNKISDVIARLKYRPMPLVFIAGGYRQEKVEVDESSLVADITFKGPFVEAGFEF